ncbi:MAG TPA: MBL fold metallo-hydrolase [Gemmatimonadaceae bacterium]|nr:MBL fold metallo-hydrolase [Gemmatimonadaceae bacterium]
MTAPSLHSAWRLASGTALALCLVAGIRDAHSASAPRSLHLQQLDVGQGDAALITTPEGRRILIDAGPNPSLVAQLLRDERVDTLDLVVASHNHSDHIGGMPEVFRELVVRAYVENGVPATTSIYRRTLDAAEREPGLRYLQATDRTITIGTVKLRILPPPHVDETQNDNSVGVLIEYGAFRALYTGDSEQPELAEWLRAGRVPQVNVLKVAHHGSGNGTTEDWVHATSPQFALISVGARNGYRHPSPQTVREWAEAGSSVYRTDRDGTIEITATADGHTNVQTHVPEGAHAAQR